MGQGDRFEDVTPRGTFNGFIVVVNERGEPGIIPPDGADIADAPSAAIQLCVELGKEQNVMIESTIRYFSYSHLSEDLAKVARPFSILAQQIIILIPESRERRKALDRLLESKDCAVRAVLSASEPPESER